MSTSTSSSESSHDESDADKSQTHDNSHGKTQGTRAKTKEVGPSGSPTTTAAATTTRRRRQPSTGGKPRTQRTGGHNTTLDTWTLPTVPSDGDPADGGAAAVHVVSSRENNISLTWKNVSVTVPEKNGGISDCFKAFRKSKEGEEEEEVRHILKNVGGYVRRGELLSVFGPTGSGKTTLLNVLSLRKPRKLKVSPTSSIQLSGRVATRESLSRAAKYVRQHDLFAERLTVREHLNFQAELRCREDKAERVEAVLRDFGLKSCADVCIGQPAASAGKSRGISGGEKKRLALATELLSDPFLLLTDEPTSGLDSHTAKTVVKILTRLANKGMAIVMTIHQPSSDIFFQSLQRIMILADGRVGFQGNRQEAKKFFDGLLLPCPSRYNPADHYVKMLAIKPDDEAFCSARRDQICNHFEESPERRKVLHKIDEIRRQDKGEDIPAPPHMYRASRPWQTCVLLRRNVLEIRRNKMLLRVRIMMTLINSVVVGFLYLGQEYDQKGINNVNAALFVLVANITFSNNFSVVTEFCSELPFILREYSHGLYSIDSYFFSRQLADTPLYLVNTAIFVTIFYWMTGLNPDASRFLICLCITWVLTLVVLGFGQMISCAAGETRLALALSAPLLTPFLIFGGFLLNKDSLPGWISWAKYLTWFHYANDLYVVNQWEGVQFNCTGGEDKSHECIRSAEELYHVYGVEPHGWDFSMTMLFVLACGFRTLALSALAYRASESAQYV